MASPSVAVKRKHTFLTIETKLEILSRLAKGESGSSLAKAYGVGKATITDIKNKRESILNYATRLDSDDGSRKRKTLRRAKDTAVEDAVYLWFTERRSLGEPVSGPLICEKALDFNKQLGGPPNFKASSGWLKNFRSRHGIRELNAQGESLAREHAATELFRARILNFLEEKGFGVEPVCNVDVSIGPSHDEAFAAIETAISWYETQPECCPAQLLLLTRLKDLAAEKRSSQSIQQGFNDIFK